MLYVLAFLLPLVCILVVTVTIHSSRQVFQRHRQNQGEETRQCYATISVISPGVAAQKGHNDFALGSGKACVCACVCAIVSHKLNKHGNLPTDRGTIGSWQEAPRPFSLKSLWSAFMRVKGMECMSESGVLVYR